MSVQEVSDASALAAEGLSWQPPGALDFLRAPMPHMGLFDRTLFRTIALFGRHQFEEIQGLEHIRPENDPFILALNHSSRREAILLPITLFVLRGGKRIHFLADWNFLLIPGIALLFRRGQTVIVAGKPAKPAFLNRFQPLLTDDVPPLDRARDHLLAGRPVGIFPEGTVNWDPDKLLRGRLGAARLSLETNVPIVPAGIQFAPPANKGDKLPPMTIRIGAPIDPPKPAGAVASTREAYDWHGRIMSEISRLSGKAWGNR